MQEKAIGEEMTGCFLPSRCVLVCCWNESAHAHVIYNDMIILPHSYFNTLVIKHWTHTSFHFSEKNKTFLPKLAYATYEYISMLVRNYMCIAPHQLSHTSVLQDDKGPFVVNKLQNIKDLA